MVATPTLHFGVALLLGSQQACGLLIPGAGMDPRITPFEQIHTDGFFLVGCVKDSMLLHGDKFGDGKYSYELGDVSNVSIVNYENHVPKEDQKAMTHDVCFAFCRTIPDMKFFGLAHGRDCYCTPYYKQIPGDSSACDAVCEGDPTTMCGGMAKSSIFEMHTCDDHADNLDAAVGAGRDLSESLSSLSDSVKETSASMQSAADNLQKAFGNVGDQAATASLQAAKVFAGTLQHAAEKNKDMASEIKTLIFPGHKVASAKANEVEAEKLTAKLKAATTKAKQGMEQLEDLKAKANPAKTVKNASAPYYPVMYFVDKAFVDSPSTCGGQSAADPIVGSYEECASACEGAVGKCVGFGYFSSGSLCFLFSEFSSVTYYTGCSGGGAFLQRVGASRVAAAADTKCVAKFANFEGMTLKPDPSGKCEQCLKEAKKANRCFE